MAKLSTPAAELSQRLAQNVQAVCRHYLPAGRREGRYWMVGDVAGTPGRSLYVRLFETERGVIGNWVDAATGEYGDLVDLIRLNQRHGRLSETIEEAERFLSLPPSASDDQRSAAAFAKPARAGSTTAAIRLFAASKPLTGSIASTYLRSRGITRVSDLPALRFHPRCYYRPNEDDDPATAGAFPALIAAVTDNDGVQTGTHRTWLDPSGCAKAKVASPRRAMGNILGNAVRFGTAGDVMIAGEGIETMLSLREILPTIPMTAATSSAHLAAILFPSSTFPGLLDELNRLAFAYRWSTRAVMLDKTDATKLTAKIRRQWFAKRKSVASILKEVMTNEASTLLDSDASNKAADADAALLELGSDFVGQAYVTATVTVWDEDPALAAEKLRLVEKVIQGRDFTVIAEGMNAVEAWLGSLPGHVYANVRQPPISTLNLAHMIPLSAVWAGPERDDHFNAAPLFYARTEGSTPFRFSLHVGDVGHTLIVGPTGAGKSVLLALMALQFQRYNRAQVFAFDFGGSIRAAALACGGDWQDLGNSLTASGLAEDSAGAVLLQPLARIDEPAERNWAAEWLQAILTAEGMTIDPATKEHLWSALTSLATAPMPLSAVR